MIYAGKKKVSLGDFASLNAVDDPGGVVKKLLKLVNDDIIVGRKKSNIKQYSRCSCKNTSQKDA